MALSLDQNAQIASVAGMIVGGLSLASLSWSAFRYIQQRQDDLRQRRFENYHNLLQVALGDSGGDRTFVDRQVAAIFELRHYKEYKSVTGRILRRFKEKCERLSTDNALSDSAKAISDEISTTLKHLKV